MTIFAVFVCFHAGPCQTSGAIHRSLAECEQKAKSLSHADRAINGRFEIPGSGGTWFECRSRHVDTWQSTH